MAFFSQNSTNELTAIDLSNTFESEALAQGLSAGSTALFAYFNSKLNQSVDSVTFIGDSDSGFFVDQLFIPGLVNEGDGLLLTSGTIPGPINSNEDFSFTHNTPGDDRLTQTAQDAFSGAGQTFDASVIEFTLNIEDPDIDGISFNLFFGSEEFPEFSSTDFTDIAAVYVNGVNYALFNENPTEPLSVIDRNLNNGNFIDNTGGAFPIEWDGLIELLSVRAPLQLGVNSIVIGVADTGDTILDSGLFVNDFSFLTDGAATGGLFTVVNGSAGNDSFQAATFQEEFNLSEGSDTIEGTPNQLDGDIVVGFGSDDVLKVNEATFADDDLTVTFGSAILDIDTNGDGVKDTKITLQGDYEGATFATQTADNSTTITVQQPPTEQPFTRTLLDAGNSNVNLDGLTNEFLDFGGSETYTILNSLSGDVTIIDNQPSTFNLPTGLLVSDVSFLSNGAQFTINGNTVTLLGAPDLFTFVFGGTPLDPNAGTALSYSETAAAFGTTIPAPGAPQNAATITGAVNGDGSVGSTTPPITLVDLTGQTAVLAVEGVPETFVLEFDSSSGNALSSDAVVSISGFNPEEDVLRFDDLNSTPQQTTVLLNGAGGALVSSNGFDNSTSISFQDDNTADTTPAAEVTLIGIADATLGGATPFFEVV